MNYIPKVGDSVVVNPEAKAKEEYAPELRYLFNHEGTFAVKNIKEHEEDKGSILVVLEPKLQYLAGIAIKEVSGAYWKMADNMFNAPSLFLQVSKSGITKDLKFLNTDGRATCAACGCQLKDPGMGLMYRYCPKCEP